MGQGNPKDKHRLRDEWLESSPEVKDSGVLLDEKLNRIQECALAKPQPKVGYRNTNRELGCSYTALSNLKAQKHSSPFPAYMQNS